MTIAEIWEHARSEELGLKIQVTPEDIKLVSAALYRERPTDMGDFSLEHYETEIRIVRKNLEKIP